MSLSLAVKKMWQRLNGQPRLIWRWYALGIHEVPAPDIFKQQLVKRIGKEFGLPCFVETGTYRGDMVSAVTHTFDHIYSIELHRPFYEKAKARFAQKHHIKILPGDSGLILRDLLGKMEEPGLFWLDAHGGQSARQTDGSEGPAPLRAEIEAILDSPLKDEHVILVDDVHTFVRGTKWGEGVWEQIQELKVKWLTSHPEWVWEVQDNVLRIYRPR